MYTHELTGLLEQRNVSRPGKHKQVDQAAWGTGGLAWLDECFACYHPTAAEPPTLLNGQGGRGGGSRAG